MIRQPIVSVLGHVDHGKTSLLDRIRGSTVAAGEAGRITQHIGATEVPLSTLQEVCGPLMGGRSFRVPGLLFIDTPGHHAFTSLRARGGALADIAILVVDVNEGFMPQTREALNILRRNRTPFVIAANKLDLVHAWEPSPGGSFAANIGNQGASVQGRLDEAIYRIVGEVYDASGRPADRYDRIEDFTQSVAIVPVSAHTGEGVADLLLVLVGLAERFLEDRLEADLDRGARGTVLELKEERGLGLTLDAIVYDGTLHQGDTLVIAGRGEARETKVKALLKPRPLAEIRETGQNWESVDAVHAAVGVKIATPNLDGVLAGAPFRAAGEGDLEAARKEVLEEFTLDVSLADEGVVVKADTVGSLEALAFELGEHDVPIDRAEVGDVSRRDVIQASTVGNPLHRAILAFNVRTLPDADTALRNETEDTVLFSSAIIYELVDRYQAWVAERQRALEAEHRAEVTYPGRFLILEDHIFRVSKPAIVGIRVLAGRVRVGQRILRSDGRVVGEIRSIRLKEANVPEARQGEEVAVAIDEITVGRQVEEGGTYLVDVPGGDARTLFEGNELNIDEREVLDEVARIKRRDERFWGM